LKAADRCGLLPVITLLKGRLLTGG